jgi:hypothetical protein
LSARPAPRLGLVIPCRNEERVLSRKLKNLARVRWPAAAPGAPHVVVVVDDGSSDATAELARAASLSGAGVELRVVANAGPPGKAGAIATAVGLLQGDVELFVLTDADVVLRPEALAALVAAFAREPRLALASGAQEFVRDLAADGACRAADGGEVRPAGGLYDRWTARVRALESRAGRLFSVHGQLLAWRAELSLLPTPGIAADDLDLMLQARARGGSVRLVTDARFLEVKTPAGSARDGQALRRARAYFQALARARAPAPRDLPGRAQLALYRWLPALAPWLALAGALALLPLAYALGGVALACATAGGLALLLLLPLGRRLLWLCDVIVRASWRERREPLSDRWEMDRT